MSNERMLRIRNGKKKEELRQQNDIDNNNNKKMKHSTSEGELNRDYLATTEKPLVN
jgi:hypothetical protein